jgi:hypothetical protein
MVGYPILDVELATPPIRQSDLNLRAQPPLRTERKHVTQMFGFSKFRRGDALVQRGDTLVQLQTGRHSAVRRARSAAIIAIVAAGLLSPSILASRAADKVACTSYAHAAVAAATEVRKLGCEYDLKHPQWFMTFNVHLNWCMGAEQSAVDWEKVNRFTQLNRCRSCAAYGANAVQNVSRMNAAPACMQHPSDPRWSPDPAVHRRWCLQADEEAVIMEGTNRYSESILCPSCSRYAAKAVSQFERAKQCLGKDPVGDQWSANFGDHFQWCRESAGVNDTHREDWSRTRALWSFCTTTAKQGLSKSDTSGVVPRQVDPAKPKSGSKSTKTARTPRDPTRPKSESKNMSSDTSLVRPCQPGQVSDPCKSKSRTLMNPGLLEGGGDGARQGPSATGAPTGGAGGGVPAGLGDSFRVR